jgi:hypothetical protein
VNTIDRQWSRAVADEWMDRQDRRDDEIGID